MRYSALLMTGALAAAMIGCTTREAYDTADTNKDGVVDMAEFDAYMKPTVFAKVDTDNDGRVTMAEWRAVNPDKPASRFKEADHDGDGGITRTEADAEFDRKGSLRKLFREIDTDGNGSLSREEAAAFRSKVTAQPGDSSYEKLSNAAK